MNENAATVLHDDVRRIGGRTHSNIHAARQRSTRTSPANLTVQRQSGSRRGRHALWNKASAHKIFKTADAILRAALYARVSITDQTTDNQILESRRYAEARSWTTTEYLDTICGTKERRPALDRLMADAKRRRFEVLVVWRLDRLGRNLKHLIVSSTSSPHSGSPSPER